MKDLNIILRKEIQKENKVIVFINDGVYYIDRELVIKSNVNLIGNNSTVKFVLDWNIENGNDSSLISIIKESNVLISGFIFDFEGNKRSMKERLYTGILLLGSSDIVIEDCKFLNGGINSKTSIPNSPYIVIASQDNSVDLESLPKKYQNIFGESQHNTINQCSFMNNDSSTRFGIRILSNWSHSKKVEEFINYSKNNIIKNNTFKGEFAWNTIELAGGGTIYNEIINNFIDGRAVSNLDIDKGASFNMIVNNTVVNSGLPHRYFDSDIVRNSVISVQGMKSKDYYSYSNQIIGNQILKIGSSNGYNSRDYFSSGISVTFSEQVLIKNNYVDEFYLAHSSLGKTKYGFGIVIHENSKNITITDNRIENGFGGIAINTLKPFLVEEIIINGNSFKSIEKELNISKEVLKSVKFK